jgi:hypothetical protein
MAIARLNGIKSDLQNYLRSNLAKMAFLPDSGSKEVLR